MEGGVGSNKTHKLACSGNDVILSSVCQRSNSQSLLLTRPQTSKALKEMPKANDIFWRRGEESQKNWMSLDFPCDFFLSVLKIFQDMAFSSKLCIFEEVGALAKERV